MMELVYMLIIYGGSFNPPTKAHLELINKLKESFSNAKIIIVPVAKSNYTWKDNLVDDSYRFAMLKLMFPDLEISDYETKNLKYKGTYELLTYFKQFDSDIRFVIGSDNLSQMPLWLNYDNLIKDFKFICFKRPTDKIDLEVFKNYKDNLRVLEMDSKISSTKIRENLEKYRDWLIPSVYEYIKKNRLYEVEEC